MEGERPDLTSASLNGLCVTGEQTGAGGERLGRRGGARVARVRVVLFQTGHGLFFELI